MNVLSIQGLCKTYPGFTLKDVSFNVQKGEIMGLIGRNGAGKTTTLKSLFNLVHPEAGDIRFFGESFRERELDIKRRVGFVSGGVDYYTKKPLKTVMAVTRRFYPDWDDDACQRYTALFHLDERKTPGELSAGMRVKFALLLALSHRAELLVLDEPTSGLDPISRDDLLDVFLGLADSGVSILFSTHITSDLDRCADAVTYIQNGRVLASEDRRRFAARYLRAVLPELPEPGLRRRLIGLKRAKDGYTALVAAEDAGLGGMRTEPADLETIMIHLEKELEA